MSDGQDLFVLLMRSNAGIAQIAYATCDWVPLSVSLLNIKYNLNTDFERQYSEHCFTA